ncbi:hypothetical protein SNEBB_008001, partial [Seison nebaliae]
KTSTLINSLVDYISRYGIMKRLNSDPGGEEMSGAMNTFCRQMGIEKRNSTLQHHESNGAVERCIRTITEVIRVLTNTYDIEWNDMIPYANTLNVSTKCTPSNLLFNKQINYPSSLISSISSMQGFKQNLNMNKSRLMCLTARNNQKKNSNYNIKYNNKRQTTRSQSITINDIVRKRAVNISVKNETSAKLMSQYSGRYEVQVVFKNGNCQIKQVDRPWKIEIIHSSQLIIQPKEPVARTRRNTHRCYRR